jgi:predicted metal-binding membrane protein
MRPATTWKLIADAAMSFRPAARLEVVSGGRKDTMTEHLMARSRTTIVLVAGAAAAWAVTVERMRGMDAGPGTDLGGLGWYLGIWVTMTAAMMLPSAAPAARHVAQLAHGVPTVLFTAGYLAVWTGYGLLAYGVFRLVTSFDFGWLAWDRDGPYAAGGVIIAAGLYELTPLKRVSLRRCRSAPHGNAFQSGRTHGFACVGCSGALMAVLFMLGAMSLFWMAVVAAVIFAEKVLPRGPRLTPVFAAALVVLGIWVALSPASVPGLTEPGGSPPAMEMGS